MKPFVFARSSFAVAAACALAASACVGGGPPKSYGDPTQPSDPNALYLAVEEPADFVQAAEPSVRVTGVARAGTQAPSLAFLQGATTRSTTVVDGRFEESVPLLHGENTLRVVATLGTQRAEVMRRIFYQGNPPGVAWLLPDGTRPLGGAMTLVQVRATASGTRSITGVKVDAGAGEVAATRQGDVWSAPPALPSSGAQVTLRVTLTDSAGETTTTTRTFDRDASPPTVTISMPAAGAVFAAQSVEVRGMATDDLGVERVLIQVDNGDGEAAEGTDSFSKTVSLDPGRHKITATAVDRSGQTGSTSVEIEVSRIVTLRPPNQSGDVSLSLDLAGLDRLIPEADQKRLTMLYVDLGPVLSAGLAAIKNPAAFGIDTSAWGQAERNMQRLLTMSPDNADLRGTALEEVLTIAPNLGLPPARLLSDIGGVPVDSPFLVEEDVASALLRNLIETHPNIDTDPNDPPNCGTAAPSTCKKKVRASLYDAIRNFTTLGPKFGACSPTTCPSAPTSMHPGFLMGGTFARALRANFKMTVTAQSNLVQHEGVNPEAGKAYLFVPRDPSNPEILTFDFLSPTRFQVEGIADQPTVDMTFFMSEHPQSFPATHNQTARPDGMFFKGANAAWDIPSWYIERLVLDGVYMAKRGRFADTNFQKTYTYNIGAIMPAATLTWNKGWIATVTAGGLGNPPQPAYFWDHLLEAAQKRLHDGVAEGQARVQFALTRIPLGLTGAELKEKLRPQMEMQKADLSRIILGDRSSYRANVAFYLVKGRDDNEYLFFTAAGDIPGASPYPYSKPGFFRDAALTDKASTRDAGGSGDTSHEKVAATAPATYFIRNADNRVYRVELLERSASGLRVRVVPEGT
jgi:hypothetical protein